MATPSLPGHESDVREVPEGVDHWDHFAGLRYKHEGGGRFLFASRTSPGDTHVLDVHDGTCSCWGFQRTGICCHFKTVGVLLKRLKQQAIH